MKCKPAWWVILLAIVFVGWAAWFGFVIFHFQHFGDLINSQENPSEKLLNEWASDGGPMVFALFFGLAFSAVYSSAWLAIYILVKLTSKLVGMRRTHA